MYSGLYNKTNTLNNCTKYNNIENLQTPHPKLQTTTVKLENQTKMAAEPKDYQEHTIDANLCKFVPLTSLRALYAIDTSGSTSGYILCSELESVKLLIKYISAANDTVLFWNTESTTWLVSQLDSIKPNGGTQPNSIVPYINLDTEMIVLYTDGQIDGYEMERFRQKMKNTQLRENLPIIIVLTLANNYRKSVTIKNISGQVNMSIPEALLTVSDHTLILINCSMIHKVLMSTGSFVSIFPVMPLSDTTTLNELPDFEFQNLAKVHITTVPPGCIILGDELISFEDLYDPKIDLSPQLLNTLCNRAIFPRLDSQRLHQKLSLLNRDLSRNPKLNEFHKTLAEIVADPKRAGSEEHRQVLAEFQKVKHASALASSENMKRRLIARILELLASYTRDKTSIAFGSNRAANARVIDVEEFDDIGDCIELDECPVFLESGPACILLKKPEQFAAYLSSNKQHDKDTERSLVEYATSDMCIEAPFHFGSMLEGSITRGVFCLEFASQAKTNPYTRDQIIGYVPLSKNPKVIMKYMGRIFGGSRELCHMVRGYLGMVATHVKDREWAEREILCTHASALLSNYHSTLTLKGDQVGDMIKHPLIECLKHVCENYQTCLRDRMASDVRVILNLVSWQLPDYDYHGNLQKIHAMVNFVDVFGDMLRRVKKGESMIPFVMETDEYDHHVAPKKDMQSLIARVLWKDQLKKHHPIYPGMKLQIAVNTALNDPDFGECLRRAFMGKVPYANDECVLQIALTEPEGSHFIQHHLISDKEQLRTQGRQLAFECAYCGDKFLANGLSLRAHLKKELGPYFYNGFKAVDTVLAETTSVLKLTDTISVKTVFLKVKELLYQWHGIRNGALHTQYCKYILMYFINELSVYYKVQGRLVYEKPGVCV